jgi:transcriptional regulator with XRE-family HTH domain
MTTEAVTETGPRPIGRPPKERTNLPPLSRRLRRLRVEAGYEKLKDFAEVVTPATGMTIEYLRRLEAGDRPTLRAIKLHRLLALASLLNVSLYKLMGTRPSERLWEGQRRGSGRSDGIAGGA